MIFFISNFLLKTRFLKCKLYSEGGKLDVELWGRESVYIQKDHTTFEFWRPKKRTGNCGAVFHSSGLLLLWLLLSLLLLDLVEFYYYHHS